jgi:hypothetical protein
MPYKIENSQAVILTDGAMGLIRSPTTDAPKYSRWVYVETPSHLWFATHVRRKDLIFLGEI